MRLIDADELIKSLDSLCDAACPYPKAQRSAMCGTCPLALAFDVVENTHTVDAKPVVRCKDCSRHGTKSCPIKGKIKDNLAEEFYCQCGTPKADLAEWNALVKEVLNATN